MIWKSAWNKSKNINLTSLNVYFQSNKTIKKFGRSITTISKDGLTLSFQSKNQKKNSRNFLQRHQASWNKTSKNLKMSKFVFLFIAKQAWVEQELHLQL